ncbi:transcriptional regulator [Ferrimonas balearica]|uniref:winged helix-turn-helix domain-containing protein n=1 Tax=Ferrimonas balearica TaxID=44012 RepID=UPI001C99F6E1|nr:helix-turn-helix domain-containing protein [Ferrimonas balearica]MBY5991241.1 helix-turn-helix domain-containing protein [Ferrimonas balearica]
MRLGQVIFHRQHAELEHSNSGERWHLPRAELLVLTQLLDHPGIVMSKQRLRCGGETEPVMSDSAVVKAVFTLRNFMGDKDSPLIQTVPGKGYRLALPSEPPPDTPTADFVRPAPWWAVALLLVMVLVAALAWWWPVPKGITPIPPHQDPIQLEDRAGQPIQIIRVSATDMDLVMINAIRDRLALQLSQCNRTPWQRLFLARSNDGQVLNLTFQGERNGQAMLRNIKISDFRSRPQFLSEAWLEEVSLCD